MDPTLLDHDAPPPQERVSGIVCHACGYDLSGLLLSDVCPECAHPVRLSAERPRLAGAMPDEIRRVRNGLRLVFWLVIALILIGPLAGIVGAILGFFSPTVLGLFSTGTTLLIGGLSLYGWILIVTPFPSMPDAERVGAIRRWLLIVLWISLGLTLVSGLVTSFLGGPVTPLGGGVGGGAGGGPTARGAILSGISSVVSTIAGVSVYFLQVAYMRRLASFVPDRKIEQRCQTLFTLLCVGVPIYVLTIGGAVFAGATVAPGGGFGGLLMIFGVAFCGATIGAMVFFVMFMVALYQLGSRAQTALVTAERRETDLSFTRPGGAT